MEVWVGVDAGVLFHVLETRCNAILEVQVEWVVCLKFSSDAKTQRKGL